MSSSNRGVETVENGIEEPKGLGGWLIFIAFNLFLIPIEFTMSLFEDVLPIFQGERWAALTTPGSAEYHQLWAPILYFEAISTTIFLVFGLILLLLFFQKSFRFPALFITFMVLYILYLGTDYALADYIPAVKSQYDPPDLKQSIRTTWTLILIPYCLISKRVKNTFA